MIRTRRDAFLHAFTDARHHAMLAALEARTGGPIHFRVSETPCFFDGGTMTRLVEAGHQMLTGLLDNAAYRRAADAVVPDRFRVARSETRPSFVQVDFGLIQTPSGLEGRLVELQAFPSLYGFQLALAEAYMHAWQIRGVTPFLGGLDRAGYLDLCRRAMVGPHDPAEVVLMEIDPAHQKTRPDFAMTESLWGIRAVDVREVRRDGRQLTYVRDGRSTPIRRIYNRVIPDELDRTGIALPFDYRDDLDVEWTGGPDWFFRISKYSIPWIDHPWVPASHYLSDVTTLPVDRDRWLLKPLFSFAGGGIIFAPTDADIAAIPPAQRDQFLLQERVAFTPVIDTPHGLTQAEIRLMFVLDQDRYVPAMPLVRMGRGKMMGVDHNKGLAWVGAAAALI